jgi:hypothetical protein
MLAVDSKNSNCGPIAKIWGWDERLVLGQPAPDCCKGQGRETIDELADAPALKIDGAAVGCRRPSMK